MSEKFIKKYNELSDENRNKIDIFLEIATLTKTENVSASEINSTTTNQLKDNVIDYTVAKSK